MNNQLRSSQDFQIRSLKTPADEVAADTWLATLALLHAHAHLLAAESEPPQELDWPLPPTDPTFYFLAEHLPVRSQLLSFPNGGWMARPAHLLTLLPSLLPLWQKYWQERSRLVDWTGTLMFTVDDQTSFLEVTSSAVHLIAIPSSPPLQINFNSNLFTQLIFGFRPISWALLQSGQQLPVELISVLSILFPLSQAWVAGSDFF